MSFFRVYTQSWSQNLMATHAQLIGSCEIAVCAHAQHTIIG